MPISLDILTGVRTAVIIAAVLGFFSLLFGIRGIITARHIRFYRMRRDRIVRGWRRVGFALLMTALALILNTYAEPVAYRFYPPSATPTTTPSLTLSPTISLTPTITETPSITPSPEESYTPTITHTPYVPLAIEAQFEGELTPPENAAFSPLEFTNQGLDALYRPIEPSEVFTNPVGVMYAVFSYDGMVDGVQWTAIWYRNNELVNFETKAWQDGTGGTGYTDWRPKAEDWLPGEYQVQIFLGLAWKRVGFFQVSGAPPSPTSSPTQTATITFTPSRTSSSTPVPTSTVTPSRTPWPTQTRTPSPTPTQSLTVGPSPTRTPSQTPIPTQTRTPSQTPWPTQTRTATPTRTPPPTATTTLRPLSAVAGEAPSSTPSRTPWPTQTRTQTPTFTPTAPSRTPTATRTPRPTPTPYLSPTSWPTQTRTTTPTITPTAPSATPTNTRTPYPSLTPSRTPLPRHLATPLTPTPTITRWPTATPLTPTPTLTRWPTKTPKGAMVATPAPDLSSSLRNFLPPDLILY